MGKGRRNKQPKVAPPPKLGVLDYLAQQTNTQPGEWRNVTRGTKRYTAGYRFWHPGLNIYAKLQTDQADSAAMGGAPEAGSEAGVAGASV